MNRPEITGWGVTTNENGVVIASINRDQLVESIKYIEYLEHLSDEKSLILSMFKMLVQQMENEQLSEEFGQKTLSECQQFISKLKSK